MHTLLSNVSGLLGLLVFFQQMWNQAPLEKGLLTACGTGLAAYLVLTLGYASVCGILAHAPLPNEEASSDAEETASEAAAPEASPQPQPA